MVYRSKERRDLEVRYKELEFKDEFDGGLNFDEEQELQDVWEKLERLDKIEKTKQMRNKLKFMNKDPNNKGRGRGYYYHIGKGKFSKFRGGR